MTTSSEHRALTDTFEVLTLPIEEALRKEEELLGEVVSGSHTSAYRVWKTDQALVVPRQLTREKRYLHACEKMALAGWRVVSRNTGGDVVPQTSGMMNLTMAFLLDEEQLACAPVRQSYEMLCSPIVHALNQIMIEDVGIGPVPGAFCDGAYNVTVRQKKVAGTAQRWRTTLDLKQPAVLAHAVILVDEQADFLVDAVNRFYSLCEIDRRCHSDVLSSISQEVSTKSLFTKIGLERRFKYLLERNCLKQLGLPLSADLPTDSSMTSLGEALKHEAQCMDG